MKRPWAAERGTFDEMTESLREHLDADAVLLLAMGESRANTGCSMSVLRTGAERDVRRAVMMTLRRVADAIEAELREEES